MCQRSWFLTASCIAATVISALIAATPYAARAAQSESSNGRLATYDTATGETYFALSLVPPVSEAPLGPSDVIVLFDTSASQTGLFREDAFSALRGILERLLPDDRVQVYAVDVNTTPQHEAFAPAQS